MKAWVLESLGGLDRLKLAEVADPVPGRAQVVLATEFAALNPADRYLAEGQYPARPALPHILGRDGSGTVIAVGEAVKDVRVGERYAILRGHTGVDAPGTFAEKVAVDVENLVDVPEGWTREEASGATLVYLTAWQALTQWGELNKAVVLVSGASGGVGVASVQLGSALGHTVVGLSRSEEKAKRLRELGAAMVLDPQDTQWRKRLKEFLGERRVDLAVDNIGGGLFSEVLDTLGMHGRVSVVGRLAGPVPQFNTAALFFRRLRIGGVAVGTYENAEARAEWGRVLKLMRATGAKPLVDQVFAFEHLKEAFARLAEGPMGKVVVRVGA